MSLINPEEEKKKDENLELLPTECLLLIFTHLDTNTLCNALIVSRRIKAHAIEVLVRRTFTLDDLEYFYGRFELPLNQEVNDRIRKIHFIFRPRALYVLEIVAKKCPSIDDIKLDGIGLQSALSEPKRLIVQVFRNVVSLDLANTVDINLRIMNQIMDVNNGNLKVLKVFFKAQMNAEFLKSPKNLQRATVIGLDLYKVTKDFFMNNNKTLVYLAIQNCSNFFEQITPNFNEFSNLKAIKIEYLNDIDYQAIARLPSLEVAKINVIQMTYNRFNEVQSYFFRENRLKELTMAAGYLYNGRDSTGGWRPMAFGQARAGNLQIYRLLGLNNFSLGVIAFQSMSHLKKLDFGCCTYVRAIQIINALNRMPYLNTIDIRSCRYDVDMPVELERYLSAQERKLVVVVAKGRYSEIKLTGTFVYLILHAGETDTTAGML